MEITRENEKNIANGYRYGLDKQLNQIQEEAAELIQAVSKYRRATDCSYTTIDAANAYDHLVEELADVDIMHEQLLALLNVDESEYAALRKKKIERTSKRIADAVKHQDCSVCSYFYMNEDDEQARCHFYDEHEDEQQPCKAE